MPETGVIVSVQVSDRFLCRLDGLPRFQSENWRWIDRAVREANGVRVVVVSSFFISIPHLGSFFTDFKSRSR